ncbi:MAG: protein-L-isoaspartate(D-aspartate) O-methyltransferase [Candidatus Acidiferrales bacterium]
MPLNTNHTSGNGALPGAGFDAMRQAMVEQQIRHRGIVSPRVLEAMRTVPRHKFVPEALQAEAYSDKPLPIGEGQTISQPYVVAAMTAVLELTGSERVLEVGTGCGYQAAILTRLAGEVYSIESRAALADAARARLEGLGYSNVRIRAGDGTLGWPEAAPLDRILVTAAAPSVPPPLLDQLAEGGQLVIPVGDADRQILRRIFKHGGSFIESSLFDCRFVPLVGRFGWPDRAP